MEFNETIRKIWDTYAGTMNDGDLDRWIGLWEEDGVQMPPNCPARKGTATILAAMRTDFREYDLRNFSIAQDEAESDGGLGFCSGTYTYVKIRKRDGHSAAIDGKYLTVFKKRSDRSWRIFRDCFNANRPPS